MSIGKYLGKNIKCDLLFIWRRKKLTILILVQRIGGTLGILLLVKVKTSIKYYD